MLWKDGTNERQQSEEKDVIFLSVPLHAFSNHAALSFTLYFYLSLSITLPPPEELKLALTFKWQLVEAILVPVSDTVFLQESLCANYPAVYWKVSLRNRQVSFDNNNKK